MNQKVILEDISLIFGGFPQTKKSDSDDIENRAIGLKAINPIGYIEASLFESVKLRQSTNVEQAKLRTGDLLIAVRGSLLKAAIVEHHTAAVFASANLSVIRPTPELVDSYFLLGWFQHYIQTATSNSIRRSTTGQLSITQKDLSNLQIDLPEMSAQRSIAKEIKSFIHLRKLQQEISQQYEQVASAYLQSTFESPH